MNPLNAPFIFQSVQQATRNSWYDHPIAQLILSVQFVAFDPDKRVMTLSRPNTPAASVLEHPRLKRILGTYLDLYVEAATIEYEVRS